MNKKIIIAIIGESGAGKDTFAWALHDFCEWNMVTLSTTRPIRDYEVEDEDYYFIDEDTFKQKVLNNDMIVHNCFNNWYYGIEKHRLTDGVNIVVISPGGLRQLQTYAKNNDDIVVLAYYLWVHPQIRLERALKREGIPDVTEICRRFLADEEDFKEYHGETCDSACRFINDDGISSPYMIKRIINDVQDVVSSWTDSNN